MFAMLLGRQAFFVDSTVPVSKDITGGCVPQFAFFLYEKILNANDLFEFKGSK